MRRVKAEQPGVEPMGFGQRVDTNSDPRAALAKRATRDVLDRMGKADPLLDDAMRLQERSPSWRDRSASSRR